MGYNINKLSTSAIAAAENLSRLIVLLFDSALSIEISVCCPYI